MKVPESGMPEESYWNSLFDIPRIIDWLNLATVTPPIVEIGCGYGTFTLPIALATGADVHAFDMERSMIETARMRTTQAGIRNVHYFFRDIIDEGTGLASESVGMVLLFNILHFEERRVLLEEASRILRPEGVAAIIHWRKDIDTPRGPSVHLRPDRELIFESANGLDFSFAGNSAILEPYHWGIQLIKRIKIPPGLVT